MLPPSGVERGAELSGRHSPCQCFYCRRRPRQEAHTEPMTSCQATRLQKRLSSECREVRRFKSGSKDTFHLSLSPTHTHTHTHIQILEQYHTQRFFTFISSHMINLHKIQEYFPPTRSHVSSLVTYYWLKQGTEA